MFVSCHRLTTNFKKCTKDRQQLALIGMNVCPIPEKTIFVSKRQDSGEPPEVSTKELQEYPNLLLLRNYINCGYSYSLFHTYTDWIFKNLSLGKRSEESII